MSIPDIWIERVHLGEGTDAIKRAVEADPEARARLAELAEQDAAFHARFDASEQLAAIERKLHVARTADAVGRRSPWRPWLLGLVPVAAALAALLVAVPSTTPTAPDDVVTTRAKLRPAVLVFQRSADGPQKVSTGEVFHEGAELQLGYASPSPYGVLLSVDGRGTVTVHAPDGRDTAMAPGRHTLDHGYQLDDAPRFERFFLVYADEPLSRDGIVQAAEDLARGDDPMRADLSIPDDASVVDFTIRKVSR